MTARQRTVWWALTIVVIMAIGISVAPALLAGPTAAPSGASTGVSGAQAHSARSSTTTFTGTFLEGGLPAGTVWGVIVDGLQVSTVGTSIYVANLPASGASYTIIIPATYTVASDSGSGMITPANNPVSITFANSGYFSAMFTWSTNPGLVWGVSVNGHSAFSIGPTITITGLAAGTYACTIYPPSGYTVSSPSSCSVTGTSGGTVSVPVTMTTSTVYATFTWSANPGLVWGVTVTGPSFDQTFYSIGSSIFVAGLTSGDTYYWVGIAPGSYELDSGSTGSFMASSTNSIPVTFTALPTEFTVTFTESGLAPGSTWGVSINNARLFSTGTTITVSGLSTGTTYPYSLIYPSGYTVTSPACASTNSCSVSSSGTVAITFAQTGPYYYYSYSAPLGGFLGGPAVAGVPVAGVALVGVSLIALIGGAFVLRRLRAKP